MRKRIVFAALALGACASTKTVLEKQPDVVVHANGSADDVAFCIADKNNTVAQARSDGSKVILIKNGYGAVGMAFSVYPEPNGSRVEFRKEIGIGIATWKQCVGLKPLQ